MDDNNNNRAQEGRKRSLTSVTLQWVAEKLRKTARIKEELQRGTYQVDSNKVAQAILDGENLPKS